MSRFGVFKINQVEYDLDDLTLDEVEQIEDLAGGAFSEINFASAKTMKALAFTLMRRNNPDLTMQDVGQVKMLDFIDADEEMPDTGPPAETAAEQNGSSPEGSGTPDSVGSIAG